MIGTLVDHEGIACRVIEVLEDGPALVLEDRLPGGQLQADQFGRPGRRVATTFLVPVYEKGALHPEFAALGLWEAGA